MVVSLFSSNPIVARVLPPAKKAARVQITVVPEIELANDRLTINTWTSNNPGGTDEHFGVVDCGVRLLPAVQDRAIENGAL
jgi:hypothetical protein